MDYFKEKKSIFDILKYYFTYNFCGPNDNLGKTKSILQDIKREFRLPGMEKQEDDMTDEDLIVTLHWLKDNN